MESDEHALTSAAQRAMRVVDGTATICERARASSSYDSVSSVWSASTCCKSNDRTRQNARVIGSNDWRFDSDTAGKHFLVDPQRLDGRDA